MLKLHGRADAPTSVEGAFRHDMEPECYSSVQTYGLKRGKQA